MKVSYAVMAHPKRSADAIGLSAALDAPIAWAEPPWASETDRGPCWRTKRAALLMHSDRPFHCVVQDDAILGRDFIGRAEKLVDAGDYLYMLFYRHKRTWPGAIRAATTNQERGFFTVRGMVLGVGLIVATERIRDLVAFCDGLDPMAGDDDRMKIWTQHRELDTYVPLPSLVDHRVQPSLIGHPLRRVAWKFA